MDFFGRLRTNGKEKTRYLQRVLDFFGLSGIVKCVEAGGIEPPSGNIPLQVLRT